MEELVQFIFIGWVLPVRGMPGREGTANFWERLRNFFCLQCGNDCVNIGLRNIFKMQNCA